MYFATYKSFDITALYPMTLGLGSIKNYEVTIDLSQVCAYTRCYVQTDEFTAITMRNGSTVYVQEKPEQIKEDMAVFQ